MQAKKQKSHKIVRMEVSVKLDNANPNTENIKELDSGVVKPASFNPLNADLNPICHLLALLEGATIVHVSGLRVKCLNCRFMSSGVAGCFGARGE
jgi:hypothetical protein